VTAYYKATRTLEERFWAKVDRQADDQCWPWTAATTKGYGRVWDTSLGRHRRATEVALTLTGTAVPAGVFVCHHCDNPICVNPSHLYVGTATSNVRDMDARGRRVSRVPHPAARGERNHQAKLSDAEVVAIRGRYTGRRGEQTSLATEYGVTPQLVHLIVKGEHRG